MLFGTAKRRLVDEELVLERDPIELAALAAVANDESSVGRDRAQQLQPLAYLVTGQMDEDRGHDAHGAWQWSSSTWRNVIRFILSQSTRTGSDSAPSSLRR